MYCQKRGRYYAALAVVSLIIFSLRRCWYEVQIRSLATNNQTKSVIFFMDTIWIYFRVVYPTQHIQQT